MKLHPLDTGVSPVGGKAIERSSTWNYVRESHFYCEYGVIDDCIILSRSSGDCNRIDVEARFAILQSIIAEVGLKDKPWVLVEDFQLVRSSDLDSRRYYITMARVLPNIKGLIFCKTSNAMKLVIQLARTFYPVPYSVEITSTLSEAIFLGSSWLGKPSIPSFVHTNPTVEAPIEERSTLDDLLHILGNVEWNKPGMQALESFNEASPWRPVAYAMGLLKKDLDKLMEHRQERLDTMTTRIKQEQDLQHRMTQALQESRRVQESMQRETLRNINLNQIVVDSQKEILFSMGEIIESRSRETANHIRRVSEYTYLLANKLGLSPHEATCIRLASPMHDAGKIVIPDAILNKPGKLTPEEFDVMKAHAKRGYELLRGSKREIMSSAAIIAYQHHEKWNGKGYPQGLTGENIHLYGRVTALADVFDALGSDRCYKKAWETEKVLQLIREERGIHFDPNLVDLFFENLPDFLAIRERFPDVVS